MPLNNLLTNPASRLDPNYGLVRSIGTSRTFSPGWKMDPVRSFLFRHNSSPMQDIQRAQAQNLPIPDAAWAKAGLMPDGITPLPQQQRPAVNGLIGGIARLLMQRQAAQQPQAAPTAITPQYTDASHPPGYMEAIGRVPRSAL